MDQDVSLRSVVASLESQIAFHREQEALHAEREAFHHDKRTTHAAELDQLTRSLDALRSATRTAVELAARALPAEAAAPPSAAKKATRLTIHKAVVRILNQKGAGEVFGPKAIAADVNRSFGDQLKKPVTERQTSVVLRWFARRGQIVCLQKGRPFSEARYTLPVAPAEGDPAG